MEGSEEGGKLSVEATSQSVAVEQPNQQNSGLLGRIGSAVTETLRGMKSFGRLDNANPEERQQVWDELTKEDSKKG